MPLYDTSGALVASVSDTTGVGRYTSSGSLRVTLVSGSSYVGLYAADGSMNVVIDPNGRGIYHPSGALRGAYVDSGTKGLYDPTGAIYFYGLSSPFSPIDLFSLGEQGFWYDTSDLTTMFKDAAGTQPCELEQPVMLRLDKSKGLVLGSELASAANLNTGWAQVTGSHTITQDGSAVKIVCVSSGIAQANLGIVATGKYYALSYQIRVSSGATVPSSLTNIASGPVSVGNTSTTYVTNSGYFNPLAANSVSLRLTLDAGEEAWVTNISVRELPGNHAVQTTSANAPVLSARVNLLTYTEQFDNAAWEKATFSTVTANSTVSPNGDTTADTILETANTGFHGVFRSGGSIASVSHTFSVYIKGGLGRNWARLSYDGGGAKIAWFNISTGVVGTVNAGLTASIQAAGYGFYLCTISFTGAALGSVAVGASTGDTVDSYAGDTTKGIYIWGADLRVSNESSALPAYQRVTTASDYAIDGFPYYLRYNGTNQWMQTAAIDFTATDKMSVFAGVRKLSDAAQAAVLGLSANVNLNAGSFEVQGPASASPNYRFACRANVIVPYRDATTFAAPISNVLSVQYDLSKTTVSTQIAPRINGIIPTLTDTASADTISGFGNYQLYLGARYNNPPTTPTALWFNGRDYGLIGVGRAVTATELANTESWLATKTGVTLVTPSTNALIWATGNDLTWGADTLIWGVI